MKDAQELELAHLGRIVADRALGPRQVDRVAVEARLDHLDEPSYYFSVELAPDSPGRLHAEDLVKFGLALTDALGERGDEKFPYVEVLTSEDWNRRYGA